MANNQQHQKPTATLQNETDVRDAFGKLGDTADLDQLREAFGQEDLSKNLFRDALRNSNKQFGGVQEADKDTRAEIHKNYQELTEQERQVEIFAGKRLKDEQETQQIIQQISIMAEQKKVPEPQRPKIVEARVVNPGERKYPFTDLFNIAMRKVREYTEPQQIVTKRNAKRTGLVATAAQDQAEQMKLHHEVNVNGGA